MLPEFLGQWCGSSSRVFIGHSTVGDWTTNLSRSFEHESTSNVAQYASRQDSPNTPLQNPYNSHKHVSLIFTLKYSATRNTVNGLPDISDDFVHSDYDNFKCGIVTTAFPPKFRQHMKKRERKVKIQFEKKRLD
jgi:hypothetical protein